MYRDKKKEEGKLRQHKYLFHLFNFIGKRWAFWAFHSILKVKQPQK